MNMRTHGLVATAIVIAAGVLVTNGARAAESMTFDAFSVWQAEARTFRTGPSSASVIGVLRGPLYVETPEGPTRTGSIACPVTIELDLETGKQIGNGRCTITTADEALAFARFQCDGYHLVGCTGTFELTGGSARLEGISGGGPIGIRGDRWVLASESDSEVVQSATGIAFWRGFSLTTP
jgi:hypothetical protein